jgi:hypothetical protein
VAFEVVRISPAALRIGVPVAGGSITDPCVNVSVARIAIVTGSNLQWDFEMDETTIDRAAMGRLAKALTFICGTDHPTTVAMKAAAESGTERDIKNARALFLRLKQSDRRAALAMLDG